MRREDFDELLDRAAERKAECCLAHLGLENEHVARRTVWKTIIKIVTTGILAVLLLGAVIKLKLMGGRQ